MSTQIIPPPIDLGSTAEVSTPAASGDGGVRLLRPLGSGSYGTAYLGVDISTGEPVEVRRVSASLSGEQLDRLAARVRLLGVLRHESVRRVRTEELTGDQPTLVLDHAGDDTLASWSTKPTTQPTQVLAALLGVAECLSEAHHFGVTQGQFDAGQIGIVDGQPRLDLTAFASQAEDWDNAIGSPEAKVADCRALAELVDWALDLPGVEAACRDASHRDAARLKQLGQRQNAVTVELAEPSVIACCLRAILAPPAEQAAPVVNRNDTTSEISIFPPGPGASDSTAEVSREELESRVAQSAPQSAGKSEPRPGDLLGRFRLERKLGEGGMGAVFKAVDIGTGQTVAIKTLNQAAMLRGNAVRRFAKEARLLASLNNPHITNLIEVSDEDGLHYIALEFVDGVDLSRVLQERGALPERAVLSFAADVSRALLDAHRREIVHRDIKPENILLVDCQAGSPLEPTAPRAKLADFGIARHIDQSESLAVTQAGSLLGTPKYMSPEQCRGQGEVMPQSDVYSLGVTLFELLSGRPPFEADDPMALAGKHCFDPPPALRKLVAELSEPTAELVARCLAKRPEDRYADAGALLRAVDRLLRGEPSQAALRPVMPAHDASRVVGATYTWTLQSPPESLWPYVSNTERLNRAIGLPPVEYRTEQDPERGVRRFGTIRLAGFSMTWEEHPFEWVEGRRMSVLREFEGGPFEWFVSTVELIPSTGGCELRHSVKILPRNAMGRLIAKVETGAKCRRSLEGVYRRIEETTGQQKSRDHRDAFEPPPKLKQHQRERLAAGADAVEAAGSSADAVEALRRFLLEAPDQEVASIRPVAFAREYGLDEGEALDACLHAVSHGLLTLQWDLLCPTCRVAADTRTSLKEIEAHTHCEACDYDFKSDLADAVELVFRADPSIRNTSLGKYCVGGPWHAPHVVAQLRLEPGERVEAELALPPGDYVLRGPRLARNDSLRVVPTGAPSSQEFILQADGDTSRTFTLRAGGQALSLVNQFDCQQIVRLERTIPRDDVLTAARAAATPRFRELFPGEVFGSGQLVTAEQVTMLTAVIPSIDEVYDQRGDAEAFALVERHLRETSEVIQRHGGEVVKVIGESVFASFNNTRQAVEASLALNRSAGRPFELGIGVHRGPALVTTANNRLDYFGATARQALALPGVTGAGVALTEPVLSDPECAVWLAEQSRPSTMRNIDLPGKPKQVVQFFETEKPQAE